MLAGMLFASWGYVHGNGAYPYFTAVAELLAFVVPLLFLVGLLGFYARRKRSSGWFEWLGLHLGLFGSAWGVVLSFLDVPYWYGYLVAHGWQPRIFEWLIPVLAGLTLAGIGDLKKRASRAHGILLLGIGLLGWAYLLTDSSNGAAEGYPIHAAFGLLFSLSWVVLGYTIWSDRGVPKKREE